MKKPKVYYLLRILLVTAFGVACGLLVMFLASAYAVEIFDVLLIAMGVLGLVGNVIPVLLSLKGLKKGKWEWINLGVSICGAGLGVSFLFIRRNAVILPVLLILYAAALPLVRILLVDGRAKQFRREFPKIFFGIFLLIVSLRQAEDTMVFALGIALIALSALYLLFKLLTMRTYFKLFDEVAKEKQEASTEEN